jgi:hypothetical protein
MIEVAAMFHNRRRLRKADSIPNNAFQDSEVVSNEYAG